ncbi:MAG: HAD-IIB family hydrolase [Clostridia bacterium]|nr:HAD-IIB family hydrolase [Clostridia bacterium]
MAIFDNCVLASDIDGTLVDSGFISPRNLEAIDFFRKNGGTFIISTGRSATALGQVFRLMDKSIVGPSVVLNGGMIYDFSKNKAIYAKVLDEETKALASFVKANYSDVGIEVHSNTEVYSVNATFETEFHEDYELLEREYVTVDEIIDKPWNKVLYTFKSEEERQVLKRQLIEMAKGRCVFVETEINFEGRHHLYLEQLPLGTSKGNALRELRKILSIRDGGLFVIGDYYNDVAMLKEGDIASTPSGAPEELKKMANFVGGSCREGAVADFIEYLTNRR